MQTIEDYREDQYQRYQQELCKKEIIEPEIDYSKIVVIEFKGSTIFNIYIKKVVYNGVEMNDEQIEELNDKDEFLVILENMSNKSK